MIYDHGNKILKFQKNLGWSISFNVFVIKKVEDIKAVKEIKVGLIKYIKSPIV